MIWRSHGKVEYAGHNKGTLRGVEEEKGRLRGGRGCKKEKKKRFWGVSAGCSLSSSSADRGAKRGRES